MRKRHTAVDHHAPDGAADGEDAGLGRVDDGGEVAHGAVHAEVGHGEGAALRKQNRTRTRRRITSLKRPMSFSNNIPLAPLDAHANSALVLDSSAFAADIIEQQRLSPTLTLVHRARAL